MTQDAQQDWMEFCESRRGALIPLLQELGYELDEYQPHLGGERYLMRAVTTQSGRKLILLGMNARTGERVVIKATDDPDGASELQHERLCREVLRDIGFAYTAFVSPPELAFVRTQAFTISIQKFIDQERSFLERPVEEQFAIALRSLKAQEGAHATTYGHLRRAERTFGRTTTSTYEERFGEFAQNIQKALPDRADIGDLLFHARTFFAENARTVEQYGDFLTHTDFVPHNLRVNGGEVYLLDHSSLRFGNKHEGWARFVNFMALYNPLLAEALIDYVRLNRAPEELLSLKLMRLYRLAEIIWYYVRTLDQSTGNLKELNRSRIDWWAHVLTQTLSDLLPEEEVRQKYISLRDQLRSPDEKIRQKGLH